MTQIAAKQTAEEVLSPVAEEIPLNEIGDTRESQAARWRLLWSYRGLFFRVAIIALLGSTLVAFLIPSQYTSTTQLMPPDAQSSPGLAMMAALTSKENNVLGAIAGDVLPMKSTGALFVGVLRSQTAQERLVQQFDLRKVYGKRLVVDARQKLDENTFIVEDRKSGIITINVSDRSRERAAALAGAYVDQLNTLVAELSTSAAHRQRVFLGSRLEVVKQDLDTASNQLAQFSSKNNTLDVKEEGKAMLDAAAALAGELIAAQSQLEGVRQIYTDSNPRVKSLTARVASLRGQLQKLTGAKGTSPGNSDPATMEPVLGVELADSGMPSIRNLPLLGVRYAEYYRRVKIQETVFELLTQQYELAKVEEAKETPSVKVLDPARIPERKSFPPRLMIIATGTLMALCVAAAWMLISARWEGADPQDPRKIFMQEVARDLRTRMPAALQNGDGAGIGRKDRGAG